VDHYARYVFRPGLEEWVAGVVLGLLLAGGLALRMDGISEPPFDFAPTRQHHGAVLARTMYFDGVRDLPAWKLRVLDGLAAQTEVIEPPIMEQLAVIGYRLSGRERLWIPRLLSSLWWVFSGLLLYRLSTRLAGAAGSLIAVAFYVFLPYAVFASRAFQPDPLLVSSIVAATLVIVRYHERPSGRRLAAATLVTAFALLVKPGAAATLLLAVFAFLSIHRSGTRRALTSAPLYIFCAAALPMLLYWVYGTYVRHFLQGQLQDRIDPSLLLSWSFWNDWRLQLSHVLTYPRTEPILAAVLIVVSLAAILVARRGAARALLLALWTGYVGLGLLFTFHIHTHHYYSLPAVPIVALSLGVVADALLARTRSRAALDLALAGAAVLVAAAVAALQLHDRLTSPEYRRLAAHYERIGSAADHTSRGLLVDRYFGEPANYHGWIAGRYILSGWENARSASEAFDRAAQLGRNGTASCLIITDLSEFSELAVEAEKRFAVRARGTDFEISDVRPTPRRMSDGCS
jgi:hypothetical protein